MTLKYIKEIFSKTLMFSLKTNVLRLNGSPRKIYCMSMSRFMYGLQLGPVGLKISYIGGGRIKYLDKRPNHLMGFHNPYII